MLTYLFISLIVSLLLFFLFSSMSVMSSLDFITVSTFECGFSSYHFSRYSFSVHYFFLAVLFLFLDLEISLIFFFFFFFGGFYSSIYILFFLIFLLFGLYYEWLQGLVDWSF
ncbi:NADH dehydrogenase subunit 3 (mitochondrion) [Fragariocoptes setiger]|uniref:NADH-ubiquinone oxidoreductase chain 3 n=1 Tax=Fragariocoptes setiger TaxID=1670756 RepID=A0ABQ7SDN0_9ACAR|nr:NADH dehydrogenase subunit 3 [Fragariocoptes setiger]